MRTSFEVYALSANKVCCLFLLIIKRSLECFSIKDKSWTLPLLIKIEIGIPFESIIRDTLLPNLPL